MSDITSTVTPDTLITASVTTSPIVSASTFSVGGRTLSELADVDLQGVENGSILIYKDNEFVARSVSGDVSIDTDGVTTVDSIDWTAVENTPTTLVGYGIADAASVTSLSNHVSNASVHLTSTQNTLLDTLTSLPTPHTLALRDDGGRLHATQLRLHGENFYSQLNFAPNPTQNLSFDFPNSSGMLATTVFVNDKASDANPLMNGTVAIGTSNKFAREDHVHPVDTSRAPLASPAFTGTPTAPTPLSTSNDTRIATTSFVTSRVSSRAPLASPAFTGTPTAPTPISASNDTSIATTSFVTSKVSSLAPLNSPAFTGTPTAPTPLSTSNDTSIATTSFVTSKLGGIGGFVDLTSNQTIAGTKTFTGQLVLNFSQNQLVLKNGSESNSILITVPAALTANRTITIPDVGFSGAVVLNVGPQNISGVKTFTTSPIVPTPTTSGQAASKGYVDGVVTEVALGNHTHTASAISDSTSAGRAILTAADHPAQITALTNITSTSSTTINLTAADSGKILRCTSSDVVTINMPSTDPGGNFTVAVIRSGTGTVTFAANGKTLNSYNNMLTIAGQHAWASVIREDVDVYNLSGTLSL
jgi:hypothetical protein